MQVRIWGDAFADGPSADALRVAAAGAAARGWDCALGLTAARGRAPGPGTRPLPLTDGAATFDVHTAVPERVLGGLLRAASREVSATAPVLVFAEEPQLADAQRLAALEHPLACAVLVWPAGSPPGEILDFAAQAARVAGTEDPEPHLPPDELEEWLALADPRGSRLIVHPGSADPLAGTDLVVRAHAGELQGRGFALRIVLPAGELAHADHLRALAARAAPHGREPDFECVSGPLRPEHLLDAGVVLLPWRGPQDSGVLLRAMASGRPVAVSRCAVTAKVLSEPGSCRPIGGRWRRDGDGGPWFEPDPRALVHAVLSETACGARARVHVQRHHVADRAAAAAAPALPRTGRPTVVLEAPFLETSSAAELSIETAAALYRRGRVDLTLVNVPPFRHGLPGLRRRAPELVPLLSRPPAGADLWLSSGWPPRAQRPDARAFCVRVDWEYGALPLELCPMVPQEADRVIIHSRHVARAVQAAGRDPGTIEHVPHGVDGDRFHELVAPHPEIVAFKGDLPAVLFVGGLIWRKGVDVFVRALLSARSAGARFCAVVKAVGSASHYSGYHLAELLQRLQRTPGAPPILIVERDMDREELAAAYRACDLLLHPYRGEGFGMPVLEARACGLPVLVTGGGSTDDFCNGDGVVRLPAARRVIRLPEPCAGAPWVLEPDADGVARCLLRALDKLAPLRAEAETAAPDVRARHTWEAAAAAVEQLAVSARDVPARSPYDIRTPQPV